MQDANVAFLVTTASEKSIKGDSIVYLASKGYIQRVRGIPEADLNDLTGSPTKTEEALA